MQDLIARGLKSTVSSLDDFEFDELPNQKIVILVVSTCGLGEYPANCKQTWLKLQSADLPMSWLAGVKFCVFGLGDSTYSQFCVAAAGFDTRLGELGGQRMLKRGVGDDRDEDRYYTGWEAWLPELWKVLGAPALPLSQDIPAPSYRVDASAGDLAKPPISDDDIIPPGANRLTLLTNNVLTGDAKYDRDIRHYEFKIEGTNVAYKTGESLAIWPRNPEDKVLEFCQMMGFDAAQHLRILPLEGARNWCPTELSVRQLFSHVLDIFGKPNRKFFQTLALFAKDEAEKKQLQSIVENSQEGAAPLPGLDARLRTPLRCAEEVCKCTTSHRALASDDASPETPQLFDCQLSIDASGQDPAVCGVGGLDGGEHQGTPPGRVHRPSAFDSARSHRVTL